MSKGMLIRGRFSTSLDEVMEKINASIGFDQKMAKQDIENSIAHVSMLETTGIISKEDKRSIIKGLAKIQKEIESGEFVFSTALEDIHMNLEGRLRELVGEVSGKLPTARSRNDQVATDFKMWVMASIGRASDLLVELIHTLLNKAEENVETYMPGFTHMQSAQPITFGHHLLAYVEMFSRDYSRLKDCRYRMMECPLGSAALAGTSFPINREETARLLGFERPMRNSLDGVSDRDFALEYLSIASICAIHMSRICEEIVIWSTSQFNFISLSDQWTTGSSIMPQKRNPDAAELVRGKSGRIIGSLNSLLMTMKALPLTFSKDMQEDKEPTFDAAETLELCLKALIGMVSDMTPNKTSMFAAANSGYSTATDVADWLVRVAGLPFRDAHEITGKIVSYAERSNMKLSELSISEFKAVSEVFYEDIFNVLSVENSVHSRSSFGGTSPIEVMKQIDWWKKQKFD